MVQLREVLVQLALQLGKSPVLVQLTGPGERGQGLRLARAGQMMRSMHMHRFIALALALALLLAACDVSSTGGQGPQGPAGPPGPAGPVGSSDASGSRIKVVRVAGADGSRSQLGLYDSARGEYCYWAPDEAGVPRCLPIYATANAGLYFADSACLSDVFYSSAPVKYGVTSTSRTPGPGEPPWWIAAHRIHILEQLGTQQLYTKSGATCTATSAPPGWTFYRGMPIAPGEFAAGSLEM